MLRVRLLQGRSSGESEERMAQGGGSQYRRLDFPRCCLLRGVLRFQKQPEFPLELRVRPSEGLSLKRRRPLYPCPRAEGLGHLPMFS